MTAQHLTLAICTALTMLTGWCGRVSAQELEPRAYSPSPVGSNFAGLGYSYTTGDVSLDPSGPLTDVEAEIHSLVPSYLRTFAVLGRMASVGAALPLVRGHVTGKVADEPGEVTRRGAGDARLRFATNLLGGSALTPEEFAANRPETVLGASLSVIAPTGEYTSERLINAGANRWAFKPDIGYSQIIGDWFIEASGGVWLFEDNSAYYGGMRKSQNPLASFQIHGGYTFMPGLWLAANATYYSGGESTVGGVPKDDRQENSRYGVTLSIPLSKSFSFKLAGSKGLVTRIGGDFLTLTGAVSYRWMDD